MAGGVVFPWFVRTRGITILEESIFTVTAVNNSVFLTAGIHIFKVMNKSVGLMC